VQKRAYNYFFKPLSGDVGKSLGIESCDLFAFKPTGGSNLDPENFLVGTNGTEVTFTEHICPDYDLVFAITDYSLTAPLTAMAKEHNFRGATLHGLNDIILNSGLSVDYNLVSRQAELFRSYLDQADSFKISFTCLGKKYEIEIQCGGQTAQKSHGICPVGTPDIANLPAGEVYFVPSSASGSFPFRFSDGTLSEMHVTDGAITHADLIKGEDSIVAVRNQQLNEDPATGILGELGFGTQVLPFAGCDIQDEKILGTCHIATGRSDHLGGNLTPELFNSRENASHDDILYAPPKTPEINVDSVFMEKGGEQFKVLQDFAPTPLLLDVLEDEYPADLIRSAL
jgi:aminopeptidase